MSEFEGGFSADLDGDGVEDQAEIYTLEDGSNVLVGDLDGDGVADVAALDADGDGVYEQLYDDRTGVTTDLTEEPDYTAEYDGSGGNLDGDVAATESADTGGYYDAAAVSDLLAMQHETSMAVIDNI
ncbi:hypothetical protein ACFFX1_32845 [Dactylosporangium sucinum]|uniref:Uncharacterized protein n=1 Tax=Dactylosporangium sucinum TaxID=1424081 RepID=A0A917T7D1_9ACTN|nr:hypothetical protein [Dactylosporangium sucinum]GGM12303.1 hypothetical protein GCM10007977_011870 [Dactylosporangium sucinum]